MRTLKLYFGPLKLFLLLRMMITVAWPLIAVVTVIVHVAGSKYEALDGENVTMRFETKLDRVDEVKIIFEGENKGKQKFAHYCFRETEPVCDIKSDHLQVKGRNVSLILLNVDSSRTGLYRVQAFFGKEVDDEVTATLVVNKPPISSSPAPPQTSTSKPPDSSEYQGLLITGVIICCGIIIVVLASHYFWEHRRDWNPLPTENV